MRLNNGNKIITEDDIVLSDGATTLSERLSSYKKDIDRLKSNVKWIYKYGGVGSGSGGGSGSSQPFSIYATLNNVQLKDQSVVLNGEGNYQLYIKINNPNGAAFNVQYSYTNRSSTGNTITQSQTAILSIDNNYTLQTYINLNNNDLLTIVASDGNTVQQISCNYITNAYQFTPYIVDDNNNVLQNEIFISNAKSYGVNIRLDYTVSVNAEVQYIYTFGDFKQQGNITDKKNNILFPIDKTLFENDNAGYYSANIQINVIPENQDPVTLNYPIQFNLIPEDLYMLVTPQNGVIYTSEHENPSEFSPGYITFDYRIYEGISQNRQYNVSVYLNESDTPAIQETVIERQQNQFRLFSIQSGLNILRVRVTRTTSYEMTYYFYVQESTINLDWFDNPTEWTQYYYRLNETTDNFQQYKGKLYIQQTVNSSPISITNIETPNLSGNSIINTHIAIGLQYNAINGDNSNIFQFFNINSGSTPVLSINQKQVIRNGVSRDLYIKKQDDCSKDQLENYHLIQIYSQYVRQIQNDYYYEISLYIDGKLEAVFPEIYNSPLLITNFDILPTNCYINLLEVDYKEASLDNNCDYEVYKYFLKYKNEILRLDVIDELQLTQYLPNFNVGLDGRVTVDYSTINNIANLIDTPTLVMTYQNSGQFDDFMQSLEQNYGEDGTGLGSDMNFPVKLQWSPGHNGLSEIQFPSGYDTAQFRASLQGSSTKLYRVKNFDLSVENTDDSEQADVFLYSPNFSNNDTSSFLPETRFTLKADVVDSSHSNNTSCGKFVNTVCRKFSSDIVENGFYKNYIRNCLEGFPFLLYLCLVETNPDTQEISQTYYYLGVYNFNLGRSSYFNLGYKDLSIFGDSSNPLLTNAGNSFTFFKINKSENVLKTGLGVAEIQGNSDYFDFSQNDPTILFQQEMGGSVVDTNYMFGDLVVGSNSTENALKDSISSLVRKVSLGGGYLFNYLKKKFGPQSEGYNAEKVVDGIKTGESLNQVPDYTKQYRRFINSSGAWEYELSQTINTANLTDLQELIIPDPDTQRLAALNFQSAVEYYTICMVLGLVDSVQKNLNIKTWNNTTWYLAFYDMDTCLGINNQGSDISYFAFSDYWNNNHTTKDGVDYPNGVTIYRDFQPNNVEGYDIPSSYLFAVAKYARLIWGSDSDVAQTYLSVYPQELYAKWRSNTVNNETNEGILRSADHFIDNFFSNNLGNICPNLVSYNYRSKYLSLGGSLNNVAWINTDYNKFNGTRINKVRDWLNGRLHILDAYFNLDRSMTQYITYLDDNGVWQNLIGDLSYSGAYSLQQNKDIIILHDIFTDESGQSTMQLNGKINIKVKCPENSPLLIYSPTKSFAYIIGGDNYQQVQFSANGLQNVRLGGSQAWTYLENLNWVNTSTLYINSNNLENITGSSGSFSGIQLYTPNVKNIELTSATYNGTLTLNGATSFPNIDTINVSRSKLSLDLQGIGVTSVNASSINNSQGTINIMNCSKLESFSVSNSILNSVSISNIAGKLKNFTLNNTHIRSIVLDCVEEGGSVSIVGDDTVEIITLSGFETVNINNCPKLKKVIFNIGSITVKDVTINNCSSVNVITSNTEETGLVDLTTLTSLQYLDLQNCSSITSVKLPANVTLRDYGLAQMPYLESVDGTNIIISGHHTFYYSNKYAMRTSSGSYTDLHVSNTCTNLAETFSRSSLTSNITIDDVKHFISTAIPTDNSITNISRMFFNNFGIVYGPNELTTDLKGTTSKYIDMSKFTKVTNAEATFSQCKITAYNRQMFNFGASSINLKAFCEANRDSIVQTTLDLLTDVISIITSIFGTVYDNNHTFAFFSTETGELIPSNETIYLKEFLNPGGVSPSKLTSLDRINLYTGQTFDLTDTFNSNWTSLQSVYRLFQQKSNNVGVDYLFYNLPNIKSITNSLVGTTSGERVNLFTLINWEPFLSRGGSITTSWWFTGTGNLSLDKYISYEDYMTLCNLIINSSTEDVSYLFSNCIIVGYSGDFTFGNSSTINKTAKYFKGTFRNTILSKDLNVENSYPLQLSSTFFKNFQNIQDVRRCFQGCSFSNPIPFNLFNKRQIDNSVDPNVYVKIGEEYYPATLYQYTYRKEIYNFSYVFYNCIWTDSARQYTPELYNIPDNRVVYNDKSYSEYYTRSIIVNESGEESYQYTLHTVPRATEVTDAENLSGYYTQTIYMSSSQTYSNFTMPDGCSKDKLCIPPDLFYGASSVVQGEDTAVSVNEALNCSTPLVGIIPKNIFKNNKNMSCENTFYKQYIVPNLVWQSEDKLTNIYSHYPSGYTGYTSLNNAFRSYPVIPNNYNQGEDKVCNYVTIIMDDSIPATTSYLQSAFNFPWTIGNYKSGQSNSDNMYFFAILKINNGNPVEGFDITKFTELNLDNIYTGPTIMFLKGYLFNSSFDASKMRLNSKSNYITGNMGNNRQAFSRNIIFPLTTGNIPNLAPITVSSGSLSIYADQITNSATSRSYYELAGFNVKDS